MDKYYVSGCVDNGNEIETCDDSEATFWTLYERDEKGLSQGIVDLRFREDAEAVMAVHMEHDRLQEQVKALESHLEDIYAVIGFSKERCTQVGDSPFDCIREIKAQGVEQLSRESYENGAYGVAMIATQFAAQLRAKPEGEQP